MQGLTTNDPTELTEVFNMLQNTDAGTDMMHEGFSVHSPSSYSRKWFAWANSLFSELVITKLDFLTNKAS